MPEQYPVANGFPPSYEPTTPPPSDLYEPVLRRKAVNTALHVKSGRGPLGATKTEDIIYNALYAAFLLGKAAD